MDLLLEEGEIDLVEDEELELEEWDEEDEDELEVEDMLDELLGEDEDLSERRRKRRRRGRRGRRRRPVRTARGRSAFRAPVTRAYVTQKQLKAALARVGTDVRRNASGIKTVNTRVGRLDGRVNSVVSVNRVQSRNINKLNKQMKLDAALDFVSGFELADDGDTLAITPNFSQLLKGAVKSGMIDGTKGAFSNPFVVGALGLFTRPEILSRFLPAAR